MLKKAIAETLVKLNKNIHEICIRAPKKFNL